MKHLIFFALFIFGTTALKAQDFDKTLGKISVEERSTKSFKLFQPFNLSDSIASKQYFGITTGANLSNFLGDADGTNNLVGLRIGALYGRRFNARTSLQVELAYSKQGAQQDSDSLQTGILLDSGLTISSKYNYLALPITVKHYPFEKAGVFLEGGVRAALLLKGELQGTGGEYGDTPEDRIDIKDNLNSLDLGIVLGVGYSFKRNVDFSVRYNYNFTDYLDTSGARAAGNGSFHNRLWQFSLAFYLDK